MRHYTFCLPETRNDGLREAALHPVEKAWLDTLAKAEWHVAPCGIPGDGADSTGVVFIHWNIRFHSRNDLIGFKKIHALVPTDWKPAKISRTFMVHHANATKPTSILDGIKSMLDKHRPAPATS